MTTSEILKKAKSLCPLMTGLTTELKNNALNNMADALISATADILRENEKDISAAKGKISDVMIDRLALSEKRIADIGTDHGYLPIALLLAAKVPAAVAADINEAPLESAVRNAVSLGGDADTQATIAGGIAEAFYKDIPAHIVKFCERRIDHSLRQTARAFNERFCAVLR